MLFQGHSVKEKEELKGGGEVELHAFLKYYLFFFYLSPDFWIINPIFLQHLLQNALFILVKENLSLFPVSF